LLECGASPVVVVCGFAAEAVKEALAEKHATNLQVQAVVNENWQKGLGNSIAKGCDQLPADSDGVLLMLCDQWRLTGADLGLLKTAWLTDISKIVCAEWKSINGVISGPPVIFPRSKIRELINSSESSGARRVIEANGHLLKRISLSNAAADLDTPADLEAVQNDQSM
jgi:CTP:molybdopterin cytidylyltransferase MocA